MTSEDKINFENVEEEICLDQKSNEDKSLSQVRFCNCLRKESSYLKNWKNNHKVHS